jgi:hypothetical protein
VVVIPAVALDGPVLAGGALSTTRPDLVIQDGRVTVER